MRNPLVDVIAGLALTSLTLSACGQGGGSAPAGGTVVSVPATPTAAAAPPPAQQTAAAAAPSATVPASTQGALAALPPLDLSDMRLWNWSAKWHMSHWHNSQSALPYKFENHWIQPNGDVDLRLTSDAAPQLQAQQGIAAAQSGLWEAEVTLPQLREGVIVAPLWLYDPESKEEIDFEFAGRNGLDVSLHGYFASNGQKTRNTVRITTRDMSNERHRFGIRRDHAAQRIDMLIDGRVVHSWTPESAGFFISQPVKPFIEMWPVDPNDQGFVYWAGRFTPLAADEAMRMTVHGYKYTPL